MKFDIYGKFQVAVERENGRWQIYRLGHGLRIPSYDVAVPAELSPDELARLLDDLFHEEAVPGAKIQKL